MYTPTHIGIYTSMYVHVHICTFTHLYIFNKNERIPRGMSTIHCSADVRTTDHGENASRAWIHMYIFKYINICIAPQVTLGSLHLELHTRAC